MSEPYKRRELFRIMQYMSPSLLDYNRSRTLSEREKRDITETILEKQREMGSLMNAMKDKTKYKPKYYKHAK